MTLADRQAHFTVLVGQLIASATANGFRLRFGDAWRSTDPLTCPGCGTKHTYQELLVFNGRSKTNHSTHNDRCAVDFIVERADGALIMPEHYLTIGEFWESLGGRWGGRFAPLNAETGIGFDPSHFELADVPKVLSERVEV